MDSKDVLPSRRGELTRERLVKSAIFLGSRKSYQSVSLREVTREAGLCPGTFYRYFDSTQSLGIFIIDESFDNLKRLLNLNQYILNDSDELFLQGLDMLMRLYNRYPDRFRFIISLYYSDDRLGRRINERINSLNRTIVDMLYASGHFENVDSKTACAIVHSCVNATTKMVSDFACSPPNSEEHLSIYNRVVLEVRLAFLTLESYRLQNILPE